jgi:hypothetical protein
MAFNLESISKGKVVRAPRIVVLGVEKIGKTSFACGTKFDGNSIVEHGTNNPIGISTKGETGMDNMDIPKFPTAESYANVMSAIGTLFQEDHEYRTAVIDSASALEPLIWDAVCETHKVKSIEEVGGGYG